MGDSSGIKGIVHVALFDQYGNLKHEEIKHNLITAAGDLYYATRGAAGVSPANLADVGSVVNGMKLGTGTVDPAKAGAGAANLGAYITGSNNAFDSGYPALNDLGDSLGVEIEYKTTWPAGDATNSAITEAVIVVDQASDLTSTEANTIARIEFTAVNKTASDVLVISWKHKFLGAAS